jgi:hypothetical protein
VGVEILEYGTPEEKSDQDLAMAVGEALNTHYPHHPWIVSFQSHGIIIRHMAIAQAVWFGLGRDGFATLIPKGTKSHKEIMRTALMFGGELLEAFSLPRGAWDGRPPTVPREWQRKKAEGWN